MFIDEDDHPMTQKLYEYMESDGSKAGMDMLKFIKSGDWIKLMRSEREIAIEDYIEHGLEDVKRKIRTEARADLLKELQENGKIKVEAVAVYVDTEPHWIA